MKISKRQLRRIIREETLKLSERVGGGGYSDDPIDESDGASEAPTREDVKRAVRAAIAKYSSGTGGMMWKNASSDFYAMADGEFYEGINDVYYIGWTPEDFEAVIAGVEGF